jgi:hypothetical protein
LHLVETRLESKRKGKNMDTAIQFTDGWLVHYNYLRPHESLGDETPAKVAGIKYPFENWADITRMPTPNYTRQLSPRPKIKIPKTHIGKPRKRARKPKINDLGMGIVQDRRGQHLRLS